MDNSKFITTQFLEEFTHGIRGDMMLIMLALSHYQTLSTTGAPERKRRDIPGLVERTRKFWH